MKVNVYDFDKTIYKNDSCEDFIKYTFLKHPFLIIYTLIKSFPTWILFVLKKKTLEELKNQLMSFVPKINNFEGFVNNFWNKKDHLIKKWYLNQRKEDDVILSANFDFIIEPICKRLGIKNYICTKFNIKTGKIESTQCRKENKIKMFIEKFPNFIMNKTYSDSKNDIPLLENGVEGYVVKGEMINKYFPGYFEKK